ncbi:MAG: hypothetical protein AB1640_14935 [bacterium]
MFMSAQEYLQRLSHALEHDVAPQIECDHLRRQVLAAVFLLDQLTERVEYRADLLRQEIESACAAMKKVFTTVKEKTGRDAPAEIRRFLEEVEGGPPTVDLELRNRCNALLSSTIDCFFACRKSLDPTAAHELQGLLLEQCMQVAGRDLGLLKPSTSMKLLQRKGDQELR